MWSFSHQLQYVGGWAYSIVFWFYIFSVIKSLLSSAWVTHDCENDLLQVQTTFAWIPFPASEWQQMNFGILLESILTYGWAKVANTISYCEKIIGNKRHHRHMLREMTSCMLYDPLILTNRHFIHKLSLNLHYHGFRLNGNPSVWVNIF